MVSPALAKWWHRASFVLLALAIGYGMKNPEWRGDKTAQALYLPMLFLNKFCIFWTFFSVDYDGSGVRYPRATLRRWLFDDIAAWEPDGNDVVVSAFSDPAMNLVGQICAQVAGNGTLDFDRFIHVAVFPEVVSSSNADDDRDLTLANYRERAPTLPRVLVTHMPPAHLKTGSPARFVAVIRDPMAALVSMHAEISQVLGERLMPLSGEVFLDMFVRLYGGWAEHTLAWWRLRDQPNVLVLFYEDLARDTGPGIREVLRLLGRKEDAALVEAVRERNSPARMAERAAAFAPPKKATIVPFTHYLLGPQPPFNASSPSDGGFFSQFFERDGGVHHDTVSKLRGYVLKSMYRTDFPFQRYIKGPYLGELDGL